MSRLWVLGVVAVPFSVLLAGACGSGPGNLFTSSSGGGTGGGSASTSSTSGAPVCIAGQQVTCPCKGGGTGVQTCADDGSKLGPCEGCGGGGGAGGAGGGATSSGNGGALPDGGFVCSPADSKYLPTCMSFHPCDGGAAVAIACDPDPGSALPGCDLVSIGGTPIQCCCGTN